MAINPDIKGVGLRTPPESHEDVVVHLGEFMFARELLAEARNGANAKDVPPVDEKVIELLSGQVSRLAMEANEVIGIKF